MDFLLSDMHDYLLGLGYKIVSLLGRRPYDCATIEVVWEEGVEPDPDICDVMMLYTPPGA